MKLLSLPKRSVVIIFINQRIHIGYNFDLNLISRMDLSLYILIQFDFSN